MLKAGMTDPEGERVLRLASAELGIENLRSIRTADAFSIEGTLTHAELVVCGQKLLADSITQIFSVNKPVMSDFDYCIQVSLRPGVKDNAGETARRGIEELLLKRLDGGVCTARLYFLKGTMAKEAAGCIAKSIANELIAQIEIKGRREWNDGEGFGPNVPKVHSKADVGVHDISLELDDEALIELSKRRLLALSLAEMKKIREYFSDRGIAGSRQKHGLSAKPTDAELEAIAQTWSEHCKHKIFNAKITYLEAGQKREIDSLFKTYIVGTTEKCKKEWLVSVFKDNAGVFAFDHEINVAMKVETHNSPSALDPFGGALTGILGVNRDVIGVGIGAKPIFNTDVFCFADPDYRGQIPPKLFHPKRVLEGVRAGVEKGGNASGIPTVNGAIVFDESFLGKPLVYCGTGGIMPAIVKGKPSHIKVVKPGYRIFMIGGRIGKDGIHGATFSSQDLNETSPTSAVQLGDPFTQKMVLDFVLEARDRGLIPAITDNGAGGLSSSIGEMAQETNGATVHLERAPLKYHGLAPWEILVSESQERMTVAVAPDYAEEFVALAKKMAVEATDLGEFNDSGYFHVMHGEKTAAYLAMEFWHGGVPRMELEAHWIAPANVEKKMKMADAADMLRRILSRPNVCSKEYVIRQYDHEVQGRSVVKPLCGANADGPSDAAVVKVAYDKKGGLVVSNGICPKYSRIDSYAMAACAVDEAVRNIIATGGRMDFICGLDNFSWPDPVYTRENPEGKYKLAQLVRACTAVYDVCTTYGIPLISGKDSMKNDYRNGFVRISVQPTLLFSAIGKIDDVIRAVTTDFKHPGDTVYVLGKTYDECGGSEYFAEMGQIGKNAPAVRASENAEMYKRISYAATDGLLASCHDCSDGGLAVALAESAFGGDFGCDIDLDRVPTSEAMDEGNMLFSESAGRFVASVRAKDVAKFEKLMAGVPFAAIGEVRPGKSFVIKSKGTALVNDTIDNLKEAWQKTMRW